MKDSNLTQTSKKKCHSKIAPIQTMYDGVQYRSRLEAKWACFYDLLGWKYIYEPFDMKGWIPDFLVNSELLVEIKPITKFEKDIDFIQWNCDYPVMLSGIEPINAGTMVIMGWNFEGDNYMLKGDDNCYGLSLEHGAWDCIFNRTNRKQFSYDYDYISYLFKQAQNKVQYKK